MNLTNYDDYDWHDEDYTGQPPDDGQLLIAGREPDTDPDDNSVTVLEYGSSTDSDSFMSDEDMDECPDEYLDDCDNLDAVILPYLTGSKPGKKKRKKKHKKKSKKKASASSKGVNLLKLAAFAKGDDEDAQLTDDEQKPPTKGRFRQPSVCQMEEELLEKTDFIYRKTVLYYYNGWYYEPIDAEGVVALYRQYISPGLDGVKNLRNHMDIYRCLKADSRLKYEDSLKDKPNQELNKKGAQLLFSSHDLTTMKNTVFRRDEIWFAAMNDNHESEIYSLYEFRQEDNTRVKSTAAFDKQYLEGRYGADPYLSNMLTGRDWV